MISPVTTGWYVRLQARLQLPCWDTASPPREALQPQGSAQQAAPCRSTAPLGTLLSLEDTRTATYVSAWHSTLLKVLPF